MPDLSPRAAFLRSPHHAATALGTLGLGFASGEPLGLVLGAAAYVLAWVYLPDMDFFTRWREKSGAAEIEAARQQELTAFAAERDAMIRQLDATNRDRLEHFRQTCRSIAGENDPRAPKLDEMHWTCLRLLALRQSLDAFLIGEENDAVPEMLTHAEDELLLLEKEVAACEDKSDPVCAAQEKLLESRRSRIAVLQQRIARIEQARANLRLSDAEVERLEEQLKLIRADTVTAANAGAMSDRIDSAFEHLAQTNRWIADMEQFRSAIGDALPDGGMRAAPPLPPQPAATRQRRIGQTQ